MGLKETGRGSVHWINLTQDSSRRSFVNTVKNLTVS
jgi:hypothetical protein